MAGSSPAHITSYSSLQEVYVHVSPSAIGSISYAEDDNRHYLGVKAAVVGKDGRSQFCCFVLECDNEVSHTHTGLAASAKLTILIHSGNCKTNLQFCG